VLALAMILVIVLSFQEYHTQIINSLNNKKGPLSPQHIQDDLNSHMLSENNESHLSSEEKSYGELHFSDAFF
jgi:hypothetical protein